MNIFETLEGAGEDDIDNVTARREGLRAREFYKYYEPLNPVTPAVVNLWDPEVRAKHVPKSGHTILTALCQLTALRLAARRCMLFFFDQDYAYILAEATRTLSLVDDKLHEEFDGLWLGETVVPKSITVCQDTVNMHVSEGHQSDTSHQNAGLVHIIPNLTESTRYCDRPFVTEGPLARFYAGVPIVTPSGFRIGALCVLDDKPRDGMSAKDVTFLCQMGATVMDHIETIRSRAEFSRGSQMLRSMESFFSSAPAVAAASRKASLLPTQVMQPERSSRPNEYFHTVVTDDTVTQPGAETAVASPLDGTAGSDTTPTIKDGPKISPAADELDVALEHNIKTTFETAATLIRSAADIDGITFVKVAEKAHQTKHGAARLSRGTESDVDSLEYGEQTSTDGGPTTDTDKEERVVIAKTCSVLGTSHNVRRSPSPPHIDKIPTKMLRALLRRYPQGKVWYFDADGDTFQGDSSSSDHVPTQRSSESSLRDSLSRSSSRRTRRSRSKETKDIEQLFSGARAIGIIPMYGTKNRVFSAGIIWTYSPVRILTTEGDLGFLRAFSDVIMSNVARLEARMEDQAKSDFISSISHELRSPLHGILGSIDFLQESESVDQTIVTQIEKCSITLMDVIEHLLEFSKINNLNQATSGATKGSRVQAWLDHSAQASDRTQSLPKLTEEVADATFYSHCCNLETKDHGNVSFVLDVASEHLEEFKVPTGAVKRLLINIINNALKYTDSGHVSVSLRASHKARRRPMAVLTVTDTGCGMSKDFLEHNLFKAFSQEDSLKSGTGLGLSLVAKLVRSMNGKIEVQSTKHVGTTIKVSIPIELKDTHKRVPSTPPFEGLRIRLPDASSNHPDAIKRNDRTLQHLALMRMCKVLGAEAVDEDPHITLLSEADLSHSLSNDELKKSLSSKAVIVLCTSFASAATLRHSALPSALDCFVDFIPQPYGPSRLLEAIRRCLIALEARGATPLSSMLQGMSSMSIDESNSDITPPAKVQEDHSDSYIETLRHTHGKGRTSRKASAKQFFSPSDSTTGSDETATADDRSVATPGSIQSMLATPSTNDQASTAPTPAEEVPPIKDRHQPLSLMIVDDNRINVRILMTYADRNKHPRITASNGLEAVEAYQAAALPAEAGIDAPLIMPEVIFMDINMPICDGFEASRRIRAFEKSNSLKPSTIIALTGLGSAAAHQQSLASGIDVFLTKPIRPKELTPLLESIAQGRRENDER